MELMSIEKRAAAKGIPHFVVTDAGQTVFDQPTVTCIGIGPATKAQTNSITRGAQMRK
jgi:peptidyl-tRNA hydrolase